MANVLNDIAESGAVTPESEREVARLRLRYERLAKDDDPQPSKRLIENLQDEVSRRVPLDSPWYPRSAKPPANRDDSAENG